jgi:serine/threonine protein kinase
MIMRVHLLIQSQAVCYLLQRHIFVPDGLDPEDERFALAVLVLQNKYFGPFPETFFELLDDEGAAVLRYVQDQCGEETQVFPKAESGKIDPDDKDFICYLMKPDPRDRPTAIEALRHPWLEGV